MDCRDVRELADSFVAGELLTETNHEVLRHLEGCPACRDDVAARRALRDAVRRAFQQARALEPAADFSARLKTTLQASLPAARRRRLMQARWLALAASVILAAAAAIFVFERGWTTAGALARAAVGDHRNCALRFQLAEKPIALEEAARRYDASYRVLQAMPPDEVATARGSAQVIERHSCVYAGRRFAHVVMRYRGAVVSLLVTEASGRGPAAADVRLPLHEDRIDALPIVSLQASRYMIYFVGDVEPADLAVLADAVALPLARQLSAS